MKIRIIEADPKYLEDKVNNFVDKVKSSNIVDIVVTETKIEHKTILRAVIKHNGHV